MDNKEEQTARMIMGNVLTELQTIKKLIQSDEKTEDIGFQEELKEQIEKLANLTFSASLGEETIQLLNSNRTEIKGLSQRLDKVNIDTLNQSIAGIKDVKVVHDHKFSSTFEKITYKILAPVVIVSVILSLGMLYWLTTSVEEANEKMEAAEKVVEEYEDFPTVSQYNWFLKYYDHFSEIHPNDSKKYESKFPYPVKESE